MKENKYKVYVYAICKNEEKHILRWIDSMKEADAIYVLDTGSVDNSVNILRENGVNVSVKNYEHFKFDEARNDSLAIVPDDADICVCTDIDEILSPGWREVLEDIWDKNTDRVRYNMNFSFDDKGNPVSTYYISKMHKKDKYVWSHSIHEVLMYIGNTPENVITTDRLFIGHYPDRSKDRSFYLNLLEEAVKENPNDDRNMHYLGREYMYNSDWNKSIDTLIKHVYLESSTWDEEKAASERFISRGYLALNRYDEAIMWLKKALELTPYLREPYVEMGLLYYYKKDYKEAIRYLLLALKITEKSPTYINEDFAWNETPYDVLGLCYFYVGDKSKALEYTRIALELNPNSDRIRNNYDFIKRS